MNSTDQQNPPDLELSQALRAWQVESDLPPGFRDTVWRRIERAPGGASVSLWAQIQGWLESALSRPAVAASYVLVLLTLGLGAGLWQAGEYHERTTAELQAKYLRGIDPFQP